MKEGWEIKKFTDVLWFQEGPGVRKHQYVSSGIKLLNVANLVEGKVDLSTSDRYISIEEAYGKYKHFLVDEGDLILASSGIQVEYIEKKLGFIKKEHLPLCMNTSTIRFKSLDTRCLDIVFFKYFLQSYNFKRQLFSLITGCAQLNFGPSHLKQMFLPIPPLEEQERIVGELDCLSGVIEKKKQQLKELDALAQSIFYEMFGNPVENDRGWEVKKLGEIGELARGVSKHRPRNAPELLGGNIPLIQTGDISNADMYLKDYNYTYSELGLSQSRLWPSGTLCITIAATIGKCSILTFDSCFPDSVVGYIVNDNYTNNEYVYYIFGCLQKILEENAPAVAQKNINLKILNDLLIPLPPLSLQQQFAEKIEKIEKQKELVRKSIEEVEMLFNSRMEYYFN